MQKTLTFTLNSSKSKEFFKYFKTIGQLTSNANPYVEWSFKGSNWTALMYTSGKLVVQTSSPDLEQELSEKMSSGEKFEPHIGSDEVGKGDYFGPLVVCACYIDENSLNKVKDYGIMDSKKLTDEKMKDIGKLLCEDLQYEVKVIKPREYAQLNEKYKNVSIMLSKAHIEVIEKLYAKVEGRVNFVVIDQFSKNQSRLKNEFKLKVPLKQFHHAESDVAVAAASIIARCVFLLEFEEMKKKYNVKFPLGATHVIKFGKNFYKKYGMEGLEDVAKVSFRTTGKIVNPS
jgi:ribonuclease HIII